MSSLAAGLLLLQATAGPVSVGPVAADSIRRVVDRLAAALPEPAAARFGLDSLAEALRIARAGLEAPDFRLSDTLVSGRLTILTTVRERAVLAAVLPEAARAWSRQFAAEAPAVRIEVHGGGWGPARTLTGRFDGDSTVLAAEHVGLRLQATGAEAAARRALGSVLGQLLIERADPALRDWLVVGPPLLLAGPPPDELAYQLATAAGPASRACRGGDRPACRMAFGLEPAAAKELPLAARGALVRQALDAGGPGAWSRLTAEPDRPLEDRLASAAGRTSDALIEDVLQAVEGDGHQGPAADLGRWALAVVWLLLGLGVPMLGGVRR